MESTTPETDTATANLTEVCCGNILKHLSYCFYYRLGPIFYTIFLRVLLESYVYIDLEKSGKYQANNTNIVLTSSSPHTLAII